MTSPFRYPQSKYRRRLLPPAFTDYTRFRPYVRYEFGAQCVYCRKVEDSPDFLPFHVDHYRPKTVEAFEHLVAEYTNLFFACPTCNKFKAGYWPTVEQQKKKIFIPNPCDHVMFEHMHYRGPKVESKSLAGEWSVQRLRLNSEVSLRYRARKLQLLDYWRRAITGLETELQAFNRQLKKEKVVSRRLRLGEKIQATQEDLALAKVEVDRTGPPIVTRPADTGP